MAQRTAVLASAVALAFAAGVGVTLCLRPSDQPAPPPAGSATEPVDAGRAPRIFLDPSAVSLLPDASLRLDPPEPPHVDAGR